MLCVEPGGQRAEPAPFCELLGLWTMGGTPPFGTSLCLRPQCFLGSTFVTIWQRRRQVSHSPLHFHVRSPTNTSHTNTMLACGLAVVPAWGTGVNPHCHTVSCTSVLSRMSMGQSGPSRYQDDLQAGYGPTAHRISRSPCCCPVSSVCMPCTENCLTSCPPHLSACPICFWFFLCH